MHNCAKRFEQTNRARTGERTGPFVTRDGHTIHTFLSFLNQVNVANGLPPDDTHSKRVTVPAGMMEPST